MLVLLCFAIVFFFLFFRLQHRKENGEETMRIKVVNVGWTGVANDDICKADGGCPALVLAGTTHVRIRLPSPFKTLFEGE